MASVKTHTHSKSKLVERLPSITPLGMREYTAQINQLKGLLASAAAEPPPQGVTTSEVERRMTLLQLALAAIEERITAIRMSRKLKEQHHIAKVYRQRVAAEENFLKKNLSVEKQHEKLEHLMQSSKSSYYKALNKEFENKVSQCKERSEDALQGIVAKAEINESRRALKLEKLQQEREAERLALQKKHAESQERAKAISQRCLINRTLNILKKMRDAEVRTAEVEGKLVTARKLRQPTPLTKGGVSDVTKVALGGKGSTIETNLKSHEHLLEELATKDRKQQERYAEEKAAREEYQSQRACYDANRHSRQKNNALRQIEEKIDRGEKILQECRQKMLRSEQKREARAARCAELSKASYFDVELHRQRADQLESKRQNGILHKGFQRWNHRAACMMERLQQTLSTDRAEDGGAFFAKVASSAITPHSREASANIPSPSEFVT